MEWLHLLGLSTATIAFLALILFKGFSYYQYYKIYSKKRSEGQQKITYKEYEKYRRLMEAQMKNKK